MTGPIGRAFARRVLAPREGEMGVLLGATIAVFIVFAALKPSVFLTVENARSIAYQVPEVALLAMAVMVTMLSGGIDLSIVGIANMAAITTASLVAMPSGVASGGSSDPVFVAVAVLAGVTVGVSCGVSNGILITRVGISPILATLATGQLLNGIAVGLTGGKVVTNLPVALTALGNWTLSGVPIPTVVLIVAVVFVRLVLTRTALGLRIVLIGANSTAARYSGINTRWTLVLTYGLSGLLASLAGLVISARSGSASADYGASYLLLAIVVAVLGGVNPAGGFGRVSGVILAVLLLQFLSSGVNAVVDPSIASFVQGIVSGTILIGVIVITRIAAAGGFPAVGRRRVRRRSKNRAKDIVG